MNFADTADTNLWTRDWHSSPKPTRIDEEVRVHRSTMERCLLGLEEKELANRRGPRENDSGSIVRPIGLAPLAASLEQLAGILSGMAQEDAS